jgi:membrane-bound lytic murein transglycosylase A
LRVDAVAVLLAQTWQDLPDWENDDHGAALEAFKVSALRMREKPYTTKGLGIDSQALARAGEAALSWTGTNARQFFIEHFEPKRFAGDITGFVTGYYEPKVSASPTRTARHAYPLYRRPPDLVDVSDANRPAGMDAGFAFGRMAGNTILEYFDRSAIEAGALVGRGLELAWIESPVDGFFIHIQGSACLEMTDGQTWRIAYDGKSGHPFTPIGAWLADNGHIARADVTMQTIRQWLEADAQRAQTLMNRNRSFIFFKRTVNSRPELGPVAAASVALSPGRSLAVDHRLHTFGTPVFVATRDPLHGQARPFQRLMVAQDTGSAIVGPARGDIFTGSGEAAGEIAGRIKHPADFFILAPRHGVGGAQ